MLSSLAVNGRNVALLDRSTPNRTDKTHPQSTFLDRKTFYQNSTKPENSTQNQRPKRTRFYSTKKTKLRKAPIPRSSFTLPVKCLPGPLLLEQADGCLQHPAPPGAPSAPGSLAPGACKPCSPAPPSARSSRHVNTHHLEHKTLIQIREARKVTDFERILSSNAILRGAVRSQASVRLPEMCGGPVSASNRPQSSFSVWSVTETYAFLFQNHLDALRCIAQPPRVRDSRFYQLGRKSRAESSGHRLTLTEPQLLDDLYNLSEYYDPSEVISPIAEGLLDEPLRNFVSPPLSFSSDSPNGCSNNFNVNLSDLISAGNKNDNTSFNSGDEVNICDSQSGYISGEREESSSMSTAPQQGSHTHCLNSRDICLEVKEIDRSLRELDIGKGDVPQIILSECRQPPSSPAGQAAPYSLAVPAVECGVECRPPPIAD